ncbi:oxidoreductase activity protein [Halocaridina rubra]|uniref:Oxidoreductase activity protein n=1 Tax=Halocaridina rubra TaxID=373956 RepID=A0AAN9AH62_HALRR
MRATIAFSFFFFCLVVTRTLAQEAPTVKVHLFYDCMCKYCKDFVNDQLYPTWTEIRDIMDVEMFPFGNIKYSSNGGTWEFTCQHGSDECQCNTIHACAKDYFKDITLEMDFVNCLLGSNYPPNAGPTCAAQVGVDWNPLEQCVCSEEGANLLYNLALQQQLLDPELYFVPWIIIDGVFNLDQNEECKQDLKRVVCQKYNGTPPSACDEYPSETDDPVVEGTTSLYEM